MTYIDSIAQKLCISPCSHHVNCMASAAVAERSRNLAAAAGESPAAPRQRRRGGGATATPCPTTAGLRAVRPWTPKHHCEAVDGPGLMIQILRGCHRSAVPMHGEHGARFPRPGARFRAPEAPAPRHRCRAMLMIQIRSSFVIRMGRGLCCKGCVQGCEPPVSMFLHASDFHRIACNRRSHPPLSWDTGAYRFR